MSFNLIISADPMNDSKIDDGGPAFPLVENGPYSNSGMSLRDWFAGQALAGLTSNPDQTQGLSLVNLCFDYADAMIAAGKAGV